MTSNSALNSSFARIIRAMYVHDEVPQKDIAKAFGVSPAAICKIVMFDSYKDAGIATKKELEDYYSSFSDN